MNHLFRSIYSYWCQKNFISISKVQAARGKEHSKFFAAKCWSGGWGYCAESLRGELSQDSDHWRFTKMAFNAKVFQIEWDSAKPEILSFFCYSSNYWEPNIFWMPSMDPIARTPRKSSGSFDAEEIRQNLSARYAVMDEDLQEKRVEGSEHTRKHSRKLRC